MQTFALHDPSDVGNDLVAILGQSNARGFGEGPDLTYLDYTNPRVLQFPADTTNANYRSVVLAIDPLLHQTPGTTIAAGVGAGVTFGREYVRSLPPNRSLLLVPCARGATGFTGTDYSWDPAATPTLLNLYQNAVAQIRAALASGPNNRLIAVIWLQGEGDVALTQAAYAAYLDTLIDTLRSDLAAPNLPFIIGSMNPDKVAEGDAGYIAVNEAHLDTPRRKVRTWFVQGPSGCSNSSANGGTIHYNGAGQRELGRRYNAALPFARANVPGAPPVPPLSVALTQAGTTATVVWTPGKGRSTDYLVEYRVGTGSWQAASSRPSPLHPSVTVTGLTLGATVTARVSAINATGTSAPTTSASLVLDSLPGQVTGLTAGTATGSRQDLTWNALTGARQYLAEYKLVAGSTWTPITTTTGTSATATGLTAGTAYNYRVTAINNAGTSATPSAMLTATTGTLTPLATDIGTDMLFGYSLRKLRAAYSGAAVRVRRSTDNVEADIGFTAAGVLDQAALLAHVGSGDGYVTTVYDQGTAVANFIQTTTTLQPKIATAGVVEKVNGVPAIHFTGAQYLSHSAPALFVAAATTTMLVHTAPATATSGAVFGEDNNGTAGYYFPAYFNGAGQPTFYDGTTARVGSGLVVDGALMQQTSQDTGTALTIAVNGVSKLNYTPYAPPAATVVRGRLGAYVPGAASSFYTGYVCEVAAWTTALTGSPRTNGEGNQKSYYGTP